MTKHFQKEVNPREKNAPGRAFFHGELNSIENGGNNENDSCFLRTYDYSPLSLYSILLLPNCFEHGPEVVKLFSCSTQLSMKI